MLKILKLRQSKHSCINFILFYISYSRLLNRNKFAKAITTVSHWFIWNNLHMFMHYWCSTVKSWIEKHKCIHWTHYNSTCFKIINIQWISLLFKFLCNYNHMFIPYWKFVEDETVSISNFINICSLRKWFHEWISLNITFVYQWTESISWSRRFLS